MDFMKLKATLSLDSSEYEKGLDDSEKKATGFGGRAKKALKAVGVGAAAITTATVAVGGAFVKAAKSVAEYGDNVDKMSQKMGLSAEKYQEWDAIMRHSGASIDTMKTGMRTLATAAEKGNKAFERIGLTQEQIANMDQEQLFEATIKGLQNVEDTTERTYLAGQLLGRGATDLGALLNTSAEDTEKMRQRVHELGGVMSDEAVKASARYTDSLQDMQTAMDGAKRNIVSSFLPSISDMMDGLGNLFSGNSDTGIGQISGGVDKFIQTMTEAIPKVLSVGGAIVSALGQAIISNLPVLLDAGIKALLQIVQGIATAMPQLVPAVVKAVITMANVLISNIDLIAKAAVQLALGIGEGLIRALPDILVAVWGLVTKIAEKFMEADWLALGKQAFEAVKTGISKAVPVIESAVRTLVRNVAKALGFTGLKEKVASTFRSIKTAITTPIKNAQDTVKGAIDKIKKFFPLKIGKIFSGMKLPHFKISGGSAPFGIGGKGTKPSISVSWYKKAEETPYLFSNATLFGAGEGTKDEMLYGRSALMEDIREAVNGSNGNIIINLNYNADSDATDMLRDLMRGVQRYRMAGAI